MPQQKIISNMTVICGIKWCLWTSYFTRVVGPSTTMYLVTTKYNMTVLYKMLHYLPFNVIHIIQNAALPTTKYNLDHKYFHS